MAKRPKITIFSTHTCPFCKMEKSFLENQGVEYANHFVDEESDQRERMVEMTAQMGVPVTTLEYEDGETTCFIGFQQDLLEKALGGEKVGDPVKG